MLVALAEAGGLEARGLHEAWAEAHGPSVNVSGLRYWFALIRECACREICSKHNIISLMFFVLFATLPFLKRLQKAHSLKAVIVIVGKECQKNAPCGACNELRDRFPARTIGPDVRKPVRTSVIMITHIILGHKARAQWAQAKRAGP